MFDSDQAGHRASSAQLVDRQLRLNGKWSVTSARSVHSDLMAVDGIASGDSLIDSIDCTEITEIDLAGIQLLLSARKSLSADGAAPIVSNANTHEWLSLCGLAAVSPTSAAR